MTTCQRCNEAAAEIRRVITLLDSDQLEIAELLEDVAAGLEASE